MTRELFVDGYRIFVAPNVESTMLRHINQTIFLCTLLLAAKGLYAQTATPSECEPCKRPGVLAAFSDSTMDVQFTDGTLLRGVRSAARTSTPSSEHPQQAYRFTYTEGGRCRDTIVAAELVTSFLHEGIGGTHDPLRYPVLPAREAFNRTHLTIKRSFVEFTGLLGYGGSDTSSRKIGFGSAYGALEAIVAPLGDALGDNFTAAIGGGALFEGGRTRFPLYLQLRYDLVSNGTIESVFRYSPDSCHFSLPGSHDLAPISSDYSERLTPRADSGVIMMEEKTLIRSTFRPFAYIEGGTLFDATFAGSGTPNNAVNPEFRKPLLLGAGIGVPIADVVILTLGYRYMQLHLATPCEACENRSVINRNSIHSVTLKGAYRLSW